jgi:glycosyltransferase involved in cell wall biosynthesis
MSHIPDVGIDPVVSIIISNYNYGCFLANAIDSALQQSYPAVEVIVVDDGSTDQSREVMNAYGSRILSLFKQNGGQASALNLGFDHSRGDIVIFLDADDLLLPNVVHSIVDAFRSQSNVTKVMYRMEVIDAAGQLTGEIKPDPHLPLRSGDLRPYVLNFPFDMTWMATSGNAFSSAALKKILPIPEQDFPIMADFYLSHLAPLLGPVTFLPEIGACYRLHGSNNFARKTKELDVPQIRGFITYAQKTCGYIERFANMWQLSTRPGKVRNLSSVSILSKRFTSLKLDPERHPIAGDTAWGLFQAGVAASWRRFDVSWPMRMLYILWFIAMLPAPKRMAYWLASIFSIPEKRGSLNRFLGALHVTKE